MEEIRKHFGEKFLLSISFTLLAYSLTKINFETIINIFHSIGFGVPLLRLELHNAKFMSDFPLLLVAIIWFCIGIVCYYFYFFLDSFYTQIYNWIVYKNCYVNTEADKPLINITMMRRVVIDALVIAFFTVICSFTIYFLFPSSELIRGGYIIMTRQGMNTDAINILSFFAAFIFWLIIINTFSYLVQLVFRILSEQKTREDHCSINASK